MLNILVVEDDHIMLKAITNILSKSGYNVIAAKDGKQAFTLIEEAEYDVVITDVMMPYANGLQVVSKIRKDSTKKHIGIIVVSSMGHEDTIIEAFELGADDYLKKPILAGELISRIKKVYAIRKNHISAKVAAPATIAKHDPPVINNDLPLNSDKDKTGHTPTEKEIAKAIDEGPVAAVETTQSHIADKPAVAIEDSAQKGTPAIEDHIANDPIIKAEESPLIAAPAKAIHSHIADKPVTVIEEPVQRGAAIETPVDRDQLVKTEASPVIAAETIQSHIADKTVKATEDSVQKDMPVSIEGNVSDKPVIAAKVSEKKEPVTAIQDNVFDKHRLIAEEPEIKQQEATIVKNHTSDKSEKQVEEAVQKKDTVVASGHISEEQVTTIEEQELKREEAPIVNNHISDKEEKATEVAAQPEAIAPIHISDLAEITSQKPQPRQEETKNVQNRVSDEPEVSGSKQIVQDIQKYVSEKLLKHVEELGSNKEAVAPIVNPIPDQPIMKTEDAEPEQEETTVAKNIPDEPVIAVEELRGIVEEEITKLKSDLDKRAHNNEIIPDNKIEVIPEQKQEPAKGRGLKASKNTVKKGEVSLPAPNVDRRKKRTERHEDPDQPKKKNDKEVVYLNVAVIIFVMAIIIIGMFL